MKLQRRVGARVAAALFLGALLGIAPVASADPGDCKANPAEESSADGEQPEVPLECVRITGKIARETFCEYEKDGKVKIAKVAKAKDCLAVRGRLFRKSKPTTGGLLRRPAG
jgi:hypothetical protein